MVFYDPTPLDGTLITEGLLTDCYDKGRERGAVVVAELNTRHSNGRKLFTSRATMFARRDGGFGGSNAPKKKNPQFPDRAADAELPAEPPVSQPLVYRLSGDTFPLHVDAEFARSAGFARPIMHGLCTLGFACRALIARLSPGEPEIVRRINCRFKSPLYAGIPIKTLIWELAKGRALWRVVRASDGVVVIDNGLFEIGGAPRACFREFVSPAGCRQPRHRVSETAGHDSGALAADVGTLGQIGQIVQDGPVVLEPLPAAPAVEAIGFEGLHRAGGHAQAARLAGLEQAGFAGFDQRVLPEFGFGDQAA
jgi:acyl dehydratase